MASNPYKLSKILIKVTVDVGYVGPELWQEQGRFAAVISAAAVVCCGFVLRCWVAVAAGKLLGRPGLLEASRTLLNKSWQSRLRSQWASQHLLRWRMR